MVSMRAATILGLLLLLAVPATAATVYDFVCETKSSAPYSFRGHAVVEGKQVRYEVTEGNHPVFNPRISVISKDGGETLLIIDHRLRTWFMRKTAYMSGPLSTWKAPGQTAASKPRVRLEKIDAPSESVAGRPVTKYAMEIAYSVDMDVEGEKLEATVKASAMLWLGEGKSDAIPFGFHFALKPGFGSYDDRVARPLRGKGVPLRAVVTVSRAIADGAPVTETFQLTVEDVREQKIGPGEFQAPAGYQYREPMFGYGQ